MFSRDPASQHVAFVSEARHTVAAPPIEGTRFLLIDGKRVSAGTEMIPVCMLEGGAFALSGVTRPIKHGVH